MTNSPLNVERSGSTEQSSHMMRELLPAYATIIVLGHAPQDAYPAVAAHLERCTACQAELAELLELLRPAYTGAVEAATHYPPANLPFLSQNAPAPESLGQLWYVNAEGDLVITFSELLSSPRQMALTGALRGQTLYLYNQEPGSVQDLDVTIEAFAEDVTNGRVRVSVDVPSQGPLNQAGSWVVLRADDQTWQAATDEAGCADFAPIPLAALPRLRVTITPARKDE